MSGRFARTHTHVSNRAKSRGTLERKAVFKSVLDNPFRVQWPSIPLNVQNSVLAHLIAALDDVSHSQRVKASENRKRKREKRKELEHTREDERSPKIQRGDIKSGDETNITTLAVQGTDQSLATTSFDLPAFDPKTKSSATEDDKSRPPKTLLDLIVGINEVTRRLESQIQSFRQIVIGSQVGSTVEGPSSRPRIKTVFVCRADVDPPLLISHLPYLVASWNAHVKTHPLSNTPPDPIKLVSLPAGAEFSLAEVLGLRRVAVLGLDSTSPELDHILDSIPILTAPWLSPQSTKTPVEKLLVPTHIKQIRTSAPKDMKAAKEGRADGRAVAKMKSRVKKTIKITGTV